jgi:hypothetical protein
MGETPDNIRDEIEDTRARMGDTVEAIGYKADVPNRMKESVSEKKDSLTPDQRREAWPARSRSSRGSRLTQGRGEGRRRRRTH